MNCEDDSRTARRNSHECSKSLNESIEKQRVGYLDFRARNNKAVQKWRIKQKNEHKRVRL